MDKFKGSLRCVRLSLASGEMDLDFLLVEDSLEDNDSEVDDEDADGGELGGMRARCSCDVSSTREIFVGNGRAVEGG